MEISLLPPRLGMGQKWSASGNQSTFEFHLDSLNSMKSVNIIKEKLNRMNSQIDIEETLGLKRKSMTIQFHQTFSTFL